MTAPAEAPPPVSVVIATFNAAGTLAMVLESVRSQTFPSKLIDILVVDGGSTDDTVEIAKRYGCRIIKNPRTEPVYGKFLGYLAAPGRYIMYLDADEVLEANDAVRRKLHVLRSDPLVKVVVATGNKSPQRSPFVTQYINDCGDPFSFFVYRLSKDCRFFVRTMRRRYRVVSECDEYAILDVSGAKHLPLLELAAGGSMFDARALRRDFPETTTDPSLVTHFFYLLQRVYPHVAITKDDHVVHYSSRSLREYVRKLAWRIKNNIFHSHTIGQSAYFGRERFQSSRTNERKYLFLPYSLSVVWPLVDAAYLAITRRRASYVLHLPLVLLVGVGIAYYYLLRSLGVRPELRSYGGSKKVILASKPGDP